MWRRVDFVWTDVSEERIASIFMVEKSAIEEPASTGGCRLQTQLCSRSYVAGHKRASSVLFEYIVSIL
jgi:hypothetical protein